MTRSKRIFGINFNRGSKNRVVLRLRTKGPRIFYISSFNLPFYYLLYNCVENLSQITPPMCIIFIFYKFTTCFRFFSNPSVVFSKFSKPSRTRRALGLRPLYFERGANTGVWIHVENCRVDIPSVGGVCSHK